MGYERHNAIIVTSWNDEHIKAAHEAARRIFKQVTDITAPATNYYRSFLIPPDGGKEGWDESSLGDERRDQFFSWLCMVRFDDECFAEGVEFFGDVVEVRYGGDEDFDEIVRRYDYPEETTNE